MEIMIEKARTIQEKRKMFSPGKRVDKNVLKEWRNVRTLLNDKYFEEMLKCNNMTKEEFNYSLQDIDMGNIPEDAWHDEFVKIIDSFDYSKMDYRGGAGIVNLPFIAYLKNKMKQVVKQLKNIEIDDRIIEVFATAHAVEMFNITGKLIAWKLAQYKTSHKFECKKSDERLQEFLKECFSSKETMNLFFEEYPVAARVATVRTGYLIRNYSEMLMRLDKDYKEIKEFIGLEKLFVTDIKLSTGDSHDHGNSVSIVEFGKKKIVYKPKNLKISQAFNKYLDYCTNRTGFLDIRIPKGIYKEKYSYNEYIDSKYCTDEGQVERFYTRYGYLVAICYLLNISDLHQENLVASGEYPVIIDLETLFQSAVGVVEDSVYTNLMQKLEVKSVANSLLLPKQVNIGGDDYINLSALDGRETELKQKILSPTDVGTDNFHYEGVQGVFAGGNNIPKFSEKGEVDISKYNLFIYEGFNKLIEFVKNHKEECIKSLDIFKDCKVRCLTKSTERYASMIRYANHPYYNTSMKYRERMLMNIWAYPYIDKRIVKSEVRDLIFNDIPIFYSFVNSRDIIGSQGEIYKDYYRKSGYDLVVEKISALNDEEIELQRKIMLLSLKIFDPYFKGKVSRRDIDLNVKKINCVEQAVKISEKLLESEYKYKNESSFINLDMGVNQTWDLCPMDESIYGGLSGTAIFYLELYRRTGEKKYFNKYKDFLKTAITQTKNTVFKSAFSGWLSPIYPMILEYKYWESILDEKYIQFTAKKLNTLKEENFENISRIDYVSGMASILRLLVIMNQTFGTRYITKETIQRFADHLLVRLKDAKDIENYGIAHGISGIMYGLSSTGIVDSSYIKDNLHREYLMKIKKKDEYKWCWGLSGMIDARLAIHKLMPKGVDRVELDSLIKDYESVLKKIINNDTLCHGNGSIIVTLKNIYEYNHEDRWKNLLELWISNVTVNSLYRGYSIPRIGSYYAKGTFDGMSGIGWMYLYASGNINNILLLETE